LPSSYTRCRIVSLSHIIKLPFNFLTTESIFYNVISSSASHPQTRSHVFETKATIKSLTRGICDQGDVRPFCVPICVVQESLEYLGAESASLVRGVDGHVDDLKEEAVPDESAHGDCFSCGGVPGDDGVVGAR
jgi:hypothetical protein